MANAWVRDYLIERCPDVAAYRLDELTAYAAEVTRSILDSLVDMERPLPVDELEPFILRCMDDMFALDNVF